MLLLAVSSHVFGGIGETAAVCGERYGEPKVVKPEEQRVVFLQGSVAIIVHFNKGVCDYMAIGYVPDQGSGVQRELTDDEQSKLMNANGGGKKWKADKKQVVPGLFAWVTEDNEVLAHYSPKTKSLHLYTLEAFVRMNPIDILTGLPKQEK